MNEGWVIDTSVGIAWIHFSQATPETTNLMNEAAAGTSIIVPALWFVEMANGLLMLQRRGKMTPAERRSGLLAIENMKLTEDTDSIKTPLQAASNLAESHGLTVYDATYLEVALRRGLGLASRDAPLNRAAKKCGVKTL